ncbi:MAG: LysM peptidoglycan-binding domain-containing protein [Chlamydiae bacterium]|nr:LysM peptidoglycan-binding domain-containing protein [Chlamydiota bacterium]
MNRKHTILIAVLVNASLLVVLFVAALTTQEESASASSLPLVKSSLTSPKIDAFESNKPLFGDASDQALREVPASEPKASPAVVPITPESSILHPLPAKIPEQASATGANVAQASESKQTPPAPPPAAAALIQEASGHIEIVVKKGDSLDKLAKEYHTSVSELIKINRLPSSF